MSAQFVFMCSISTGDVQIGLMDKKGQLEVEVIRARGLTPKPGSKSLPGNTNSSGYKNLNGSKSDLSVTESQYSNSNFSRCISSLLPTSCVSSPILSLCCLLTPAPYVKVYLLDNGNCKAKKKTKIARKTLEPLYQQNLLFEESPQGKVLQVMFCVDLSTDQLFLCNEMSI